MGKDIDELNGDKKCPMCGKAFFVPFPSMWTYARREGPSIKYFHSYSCVRAYDKQKGEKKVGKRKITKDQEREAVRIALAGGDPLTFLEECGINNPAQKWYDIKYAVKDSDPETYAKLPMRIQRKDAVKVDKTEVTLADAMTGMQNAADQFFGKCKDMGVKIETPEQPKITQPVNYDGMMVREVEGLFARYRRSDVSGQTYIDVEIIDGTDTLSYTIDQWRSFRKEHNRAAMILGVEL